MRRVIAWSVMGVCLALVLASIGWALKTSAERALLYAPLPAITPTTPLPTPTAQDTRFVIQSTDYISHTVRIAFAAKQIKGDWLYESPLLRVGEQEYMPSPASLKQARLDLLQTITAGQAVSAFTFEKVAEGNAVAILILNPASQPTDIVSPRLEIIVTWRAK